MEVSIFISVPYSKHCRFKFDLRNACRDLKLQYFDYSRTRLVHSLSFSVIRINLYCIDPIKDSIPFTPHYSVFHKEPSSSFGSLAVLGSTLVFLLTRAATSLCKLLPPFPAMKAGILILSKLLCRLFMLPTICGTLGFLLAPASASVGRYANHPADCLISITNSPLLLLSLICFYLTGSCE